MYTHGIRSTTRGSAQVKRKKPHARLYCIANDDGGCAGGVKTQTRRITARQCCVPVHYCKRGGAVWCGIIDGTGPCREVLKEKPFAFSKGVLAEILEPIMGQGLIPAPYAVWKNRQEGRGGEVFFFHPHRNHALFPRLFLCLKQPFTTTTNTKRVFLSVEASRMAERMRVA